MFIWEKFISLTWWQMSLWVAYTLYFIARSWRIWEETNWYGIKKGYKNVFIGEDKHFRLYHVVRTILDIPPMIVGLFFPAIKKVLSVKLYTFKEEEKKND